ncbi:MAG: site-2 protease family protein [Elusimicrobiota bacterium]
MFGKGITLFKIFGFAIRIDPSWIFIAILVTWSLASGLFPHQYRELSAATYWWMGVVGALGLFASIIFHELCHSLVARRFGLQMRGITLFIFGGVAEMEEEPPSAKAEFFMAIIGPISSIFLGFIFWGADVWGRNNAWPEAIYGVFGYLKWINWVLAGFNLVPAFPLDGGRVFRSILWQWKNNLRWATHVSSQIGSLFGLLLIIWGIFSIFMGAFVNGMWYFLIGMFLRNAAAMSYQRLLIRRALEGETVKRFMKLEPTTVPPDISLAELIEDYFYKYHYKMFPVVEQEKLLGCISSAEIKQIPRQDWKERKVQDLLTPCSSANSISIDTDAMKALSIMTKTGKTRLMVVEDGHLAGIITLKDLLKFFSLKLDIEGEDF